MDDDAVSTARRAGWQLVCLCAGWCRLCESYRAVFDEVGARLQREWPELRSRWIDIEDEASLCGDLDIETFPTILVCSPQGVHFAGPLAPQPATLERVVRAALAAPATAGASDFAALAGRLSHSGSRGRAAE